MSPVGSSDASFWAHIPSWMWPVILMGILGFFVYEAIRGSEKIASVFGHVGQRIYDRASAPRKALSHIEHIEDLLNAASDKLECTTTYLVLDAEWHHQADLIIAESYPQILQRLPKRLPYTEFSRKWGEGWRP